MFALLYDPVSEIKKAKRQSFARVLMYLLTASLFATVGVFFFAWRYSSAKLSQTFIINGTLVVLFSLMVLSAIFAFFFSLAMHVLDGRGGYYEGLSAVVLSMVAPAMMIFFGGALSFMPYGFGFAGLLAAYGFVIGTATLFRASKELFELDYAGVLVGFLISLIPVCFALMGVRLAIQSFMAVL